MDKQPLECTRFTHMRSQTQIIVQSKSSVTWRPREADGQYVKVWYTWIFLFNLRDDVDIIIQTFMHKVIVLSSCFLQVCLIGNVLRVISILHLSKCFDLLVFFLLVLSHSKWGKTYTKYINKYIKNQYISICTPWDIFLRWVISLPWILYLTN